MHYKLSAFSSLVLFVIINNQFPKFRKQLPTQKVNIGFACLQCGKEIRVVGCGVIGITVTG